MYIIFDKFFPCFTSSIYGLLKLFKRLLSPSRISANDSTLGSLLSNIWVFIVGNFILFSLFISSTFGSFSILFSTFGSFKFKGGFIFIFSFGIFSPNSIVLFSSFSFSSFIFV